MESGEAAAHTEGVHYPSDTMELSYRGHAYEPQSTSVEVVETDQTAQFLGRSFKIKQVKDLPRQGQPMMLKYRGASYLQ